MLSIVIPVLNESENIRPLLAEIDAIARKAPVNEIIYVDDGSTDDTLAVLKACKKDFKKLRIIRHETCCGQSAALWSGITAAKGDVIVTLDGDGQNDPADIPLVFERFAEQGGPDAKVMVAGQRRKRQDNWLRRVSSRVANGVRSALLRDGTRDTGCSLKIFRRADYLALPYFNHMHRFLPALMKTSGVGIVHMDVAHRPRARGVSKYGVMNRLWAGIVDLFGVMWLMRRARPRVAVREEGTG